MTTKNDRIRRAYAVFRQVFSYGIDGHAFLPSAGARQAIDLTPERFFSDLYEPRPIEQDYLERCLASNLFCVWLIGPVGVGKSTLAHYQLQKYNEAYNLPRFVIDFKTHDCHSHTADELHEWIRDQLLAQVRSYCLSKNITDAQLAVVFFRDDLYKILTGESNRAFHEICQSFHRRQTQEYNSERLRELRQAWVESCVAPSTTADPDLRERLFDMGKLLTLEERLYAAAELVRPHDARHLPVALLDNIDSIEDLKARRLLKDWLRSQAERLNHVATFLVTVRPENGDYYLSSEDIQKTQKAGRLDPDQLPSYSSGAVHHFQIDVTAPFISDEMHTRAAQLRGEPYADSEDRIVELDGEYSARDRQIIFDELIYSRRLNFLANLATGNVITAGIPAGYNSDDIRAIAGACSEVMRITAIRIDSQQLANRNRRDMLAAVATFVMYVVNTLNLDWDKIGGNDVNRTGRRNSFLKSLYYRWLASASENDTEQAVLNVDVFNPAKWVRDAGWKELADRSYQLEADTSALPRYLSSMLDYYILSAIYNLGGNNLRDRWRNPIDVAHVVRAFADLGVEESVVLERMTNLVRRRKPGIHSFVEITRFREILNSASPVGLSDEVCATDRTCCLLEHTGVMFNYVAELLDRYDKRDRVGDGTERWYSDRIVSKTRARAVVLWLKMGITQEIRIIEHFLRYWKGSPEELVNQYLSKFTIALNRESPRSLVYLMYLRVIRAFFEHAAVYTTTREDADAIKGHIQELGGIELYVHNTIVPSLRRGRVEMIPRDVPVNVPRQAS